MRAFTESIVKPCKARFEKAEGELEVIMTERESARGTARGKGNYDPAVEALRRVED